MAGEAGQESVDAGSKSEFRALERGELGAEEGAKSDACSDIMDRRLDIIELIESRGPLRQVAVGGVAGDMNPPGVRTWRFFLDFLDSTLGVTW